MVKASTIPPFTTGFMIHRLHTPSLWQKDEIFKTVYKPNIAKTVYTSVLHLFMYKDKTVKSNVFCIYREHHKFVTNSTQADVLQMYRNVIHVCTESPDY